MSFVLVNISLTALTIGLWPSDKKLELFELEQVMYWLGDGNEIVK